MNQQRIAQLEQELEQALAHRQQVVEERTLYPGRDTDTLRGNYQREENRRSSLRAIDETIEACKRELAFYRSL